MRTRGGLGSTPVSAATISPGQELGHGARAPADPEQRMALIRDTTARALAGERTGLAAFDALAVVVAECGIPRSLIDDHIAGFALDAAGWRPRDQDDLLLYCYRVAGAVGCMMAVVMGVRRRTRRRSAGVGSRHLFQLANIASI